MFPVAFSDPDIAFVLIMLGALGLYWELHAPGMMVPGLAGVLLICAGVYGLYQDAPTWYGAALLVFAVMLLTIELKYYTHMLAGITGSVLLAVGAIVLFEGPRRVTPALAVAAAAALGVIVIFLGLLGMRARKSVRLTGIQQLIGESGVARTALDPAGMVLVRGEYWQATSDHAIPAGRRVSVERAQNLLLYVKES
jgi:membrane-bound serine protease (ClpP class)